jgi:predicted nucleic acid-binding protein
MLYSMGRRVLIDTSAIFAIISPSDRLHDRAAATYGDLLDQGDRLYITSYIMVETAALVQRRLGFELLQVLVQSMQGVIDIFWVDRAAHEEAWRRMVERGGGRISLVDWSTIVVAEQTSSTIFAFDQDFSAQGLQVLP